MIIPPPSVRERVIEWMSLAWFLAMSLALVCVAMSLDKPHALLAGVICFYFWVGCLAMFITIRRRPRVQRHLAEHGWFLGRTVFAWLLLAWPWHVFRWLTRHPQ